MKGAKKNPKNKKIITKPPLRQGYGTVPVRITANSASLLNGKETATDSITPSDIVNNTLQTSAETIIHVPKARGHYIAKDPEEEERNRGNQEFKNGNFPAAVKFYTKCLGLKVACTSFRTIHQSNKFIITRTEQKLYSLF